MKKHKLIATVGTLALLANILVPGLAFGQSDQTASQTIDCQAGRTLSITETPGDLTGSMTFDNLTASASAQNSFDSNVLDGVAQVPYFASLNNDHDLIVDDTRSGGVGGCPVSTPGFTVTAQITSANSSLVKGFVTSPGPGQLTIPATSFHIITANEFGGPLSPACFGGFTAVPSENEVCYQPHAGTLGTPGNLRDVNEDFLYDDVARDPDVSFDAFRTPSVYTNEIAIDDAENTPTGRNWANTLESPVTIMNTSTGHDAAFFTDTALYGRIPAGQSPGVYTGTITYTVAPL